ncbi:hypothetical protein HPB52_005065 [Rhipicephalus sanguineus]|uniref:Nose resistant-to-fluoxetine protein N-terminal domain-containing protein n=1 Tax=Rhipicephalus sanguineus TaxID=34632 RepID=A0A9D4QGF2_RHISA|nr:hypothetical protein HPB52_005065 [Rhipicephalus sanguineus]
MGWPSAAMLLFVVALLCVAARGPLAAEAAAATKQPAKFESTTTALPASTAAKLRAAPADDDGKNDVQDRPVTSGVELEDYDDAADELPSTDLKARAQQSATPGEESDDEDDEDDDYDSTDDFDDATQPSESTTGSTPTTAKAGSSTTAAEQNAATKSIGEPTPLATTNVTKGSTAPTTQPSTTTNSASSVTATATTTTTLATSPTTAVTTASPEVSTVSATSTQGSKMLKADATTTGVESTTSLAEPTSVSGTTENPDVTTAVKDGSDVTVKSENEPEFSGDNQIAAYEGAASSLSVRAVESTTSSTTTTEPSTTESTTTESTTTESTTTESTTTESTTTESTTTESTTAEGTTVETTSTETSTTESSTASSDEVSTTADSTTESDSTTSSETTSAVTGVEGSTASGAREMEDLDDTGGTTTQSTPEITTVRDYEPDLNAVINQFMTQILPLTTRFLSDTNVSADCVNHLWKVYQGFRRQDAWALRLVTSSGLIPANLFEGSLSNLGSYEQCLRTRAVNSEGEVEVQGRYCSLFFRPPPLYYNRTSEQFKAIGEMQGRRSLLNWEKGERGYISSDVRVGLCIPSGCSAHDISHLANLIVQDYGARAVVKSCRIDEPFTLSDLQIGILCALGGSVGLVLLATLVEICLFCCSNHKVSDPKYDVVPVKVVKCFSLVHNTRRLISTHFDTNCPRKPVRFVYGVKVFMMLWIILGHSYYTSNFQTLREHMIHSFPIRAPWPPLRGPVYCSELPWVMRTKNRNVGKRNGSPT